MQYVTRYPDWREGDTGIVANDVRVCCTTQNSWGCWEKLDANWHEIIHLFHFCRNLLWIGCEHRLTRLRVFIFVVLSVWRKDDVTQVDGLVIKVKDDKVNLLWLKSFPCVLLVLDFKRTTAYAPANLPDALRVQRCFVESRITNQREMLPKIWSKLLWWLSTGLALA